MPQTSKADSSDQMAEPDLDRTVVPAGLFLRTKLLPPRPAPELLSRERLMDRLRSNLSRPVTLVTANAGSGKTTLVADFVRSLGQKFVWYQLDHTDADPLVFLGYLTHGIKYVVPQFGKVTNAYLAQAADELLRQPERAVDVLLNDVLENADRQLVIVLDDYHHLGQDTAVHVILDRLLQYLPDLMHVIIISRDMPPLSLARLRSQASLAVIDRDELLFTDEETRHLFRKVFDVDLKPEQLTEYRERTHGWITALQLIRQVAQRRNFGAPSNEKVNPDLVEILRQSERDIFDYFAEEVFADESAEVQSLLLRMAILDRLDIDTCGALFPDANCQIVLPTLVRRNVFITVASDGRGEEYRLHPLFQSFLRKRIRTEVGRANLASEQLRYAQFYLDRRNFEGAVRHLIAGEDFETAVALIAEHGNEWINSGALTLLASLFSSLPPDSLERHPRAIAFQAELARIRGEFDKAQSLLHRAAALLHQSDDAEGEAEVLHSQATIYRRRGDFESSLRLLDQAESLVGAESRVRIKCGNTRGLCLMAKGQLEAAERQFRVALQAAEAGGDEHYTRLIAHNLGLPSGMRGDFGEALRWSRRMLTIDGAGTPMPQEATAHLNIARFHLYRGELEDCERHLEMALERSQLFNLTMLSGEFFEAFGALQRERGDAVQASEFFERAARAYEESGVDLSRTELFEEQALLALLLNDAVTARSILDRLVAKRSESNDVMRTSTAALTRGRVMLFQRDFDSARAELFGPLDYFHKNRLYYYEAQASFALAVVEFETANDPKMLLYLRRALDLAARYDYEYWLKHAVANSRNLLAHPDAVELFPIDIRDHVRQLEGSAHAPAVITPVTYDQHLTDLSIRMLGPVEIVRDPRRSLSAEAWTTKRARDILCFIASRPHRRASKDLIIDTFWSDADFDAVEKNFHPTVSHIRKALNSNQPIKQNFLLYRDGDYQLNAEFSYAIDIEEFYRLILAGDAARRKGGREEYVDLYEQAIAFYRGEFMQGTYDVWAEDQRSYYRGEYLRLLESLAGVAQKEGDWSRSIQLAQTILHDDPYREDVHCKLLRGHSALGNRGAVKEHYDSLRRLFREELGIEPSLETQRLYRELMQ